MDRRTLLRGAGVALGLPLLEAMVPSAAQAAAAAMSTKRLQVFYLPNGMVMQDLVPKQVGAGYEMSPILKPLEAYRDRFSVISGLAHDEGNAKGDGPGDHARACASYLTGTHPKKSEGSSIHAGVSMDQLVAQHIGRDTTLPSLELGIEPSST